jgi:hypothetical protein
VAVPAVHLAVRRDRRREHERDRVRRRAGSRACDADPALGYELLRRFVQVVVDRLQSTRIRLLDLYGQP